MERSRRNDLLIAVPAFVAFGLGLVYGLGAIAIYGQLKGAGLNGVESMAAVPLDQILSRGIGQTASSFNKALFYSLVIAVCAAFVYPYGTSAAPPPAEPKDLPWGISHLTRLARSPTALCLLAALVAALTLADLPQKEALALAITLALTVVVLVYAWKETRRRGEWGVRRMVVVYAAAYGAYLVSLTLATALVNPAPLPHVRLQTAAATSIEGGLVADSGGSWYVAQENHSVLAVSSRRVRRSFITYPGRAPEQTALDWIFNRAPSKR